jgi:preprotein translocase subunit SecE
MATKTAMANDNDRAIKKQGPGPFDNVTGKWAEFTGFLSDVRAEMRKVVAPSRKEVEVTTGVVIVAVFLFGLFFFITDWVFRVGINGLLNKLGGMQ